jgi:protein-disulfide isomerase
MNQKNHHSPATEMTSGRKWLLIAGITVAAMAFFALVVFAGSLSRQTTQAAKVDLAHLETGVTAEGFPYQGSPDAPVKLIEYSDYLCGHCRAFVLEKEPQLIDEYVATGKVQYISHYYALGEAQVFLVEAAHCAADQERFWPYYRTMFENQARFRSVESLEDLQTLLNEFAGQADLDVSKFEACWNSHQHRQDIIESIQAAYEKGVQSTPTFSVQGEMIVGNQPYEVFQQAIENSLAEVEE